MDTSSQSRQLDLPAEEHRRVARAFTATVEGVAPSAWDRPAPPEGWVAHDVVRHLVEWFPGLPGGGTGITLPAGPSVDDDPVGAWRTQTDAVQALLDDPATAEQRYELPHLGTMPLGQAIAMIYTGDVFLHRWDLARATGQDETLDPDTCRQDAGGHAADGCGAAPERPVRTSRRGTRRCRRPDEAAGVHRPHPVEALVTAIGHGEVIVDGGWAAGTVPVQSGCDDGESVGTSSPASHVRNERSRADADQRRGPRQRR